MEFVGPSSLRSVLISVRDEIVYYADPEVFKSPLEPLSAQGPVWFAAWAMTRGSPRRRRSGSAGSRRTPLKPQTRKGVAMQHNILFWFFFFSNMQDLQISFVLLQVWLCCTYEKEDFSHVLEWALVWSSATLLITCTSTSGVWQELMHKGKSSRLLV